MPIRYHRPTGYECPTSVLNHHNSMSSNGKLCSRAVAKSRPAKPIGPNSEATAAFSQSVTQADARSSDPRSSDASDAHAYADAYAEEEQLCPARELLGAIEHCGTSSARGAFCTNSRPFCGAPSRRKQSLRQRSSFTCRPAQRKIFFSWWSGGPFQADGGGEERAGRGCKWPGRTYLQCLGPLHWSLG